MRLRVWFGVGVAVVTVVVAATAFARSASEPFHEAVAPASSAVSGACSRATALKVMYSYRLLIKDPTVSKPIRQVLCGAFTGPRSRARAVSVAAATCRPVAGWQAFRYANGGWRRAPGGNHGGVLLDKIAKSGNAIVETEPAPRRRETACTASNERSRPWRWNGSRLVPGSWTVSPGVTVIGPGQSFLSFLAPGRRIWCEIEKDRLVPRNDTFCGTKDLKHLGTVKRNGAVEICTAASADPADVCLQNWDDDAVVLRVGRTVKFNGFRCSSETKGITCTVIAGTGKGKGFLINATGATKIG